jgi:5'-3' exonuclease
VVPGVPRGARLRRVARRAADRRGARLPGPGVADRARDPADPAGRHPGPGLAAGLSVILELLAALGVPAVGAAGHEADDVIGTLATRAVGAVDVVSGDRDMFQLVRDDGPVRVLYAVEKMRPYGEAEVAAKYGIPGRSYAEYAVLRGDPSDGLPGVKGVGDKTAAALVSRFGGVEGLLAALDAGQQDGFPAGSRAKLKAARDYLAVGPAVTRLVCDLNLPAYDDALPRTPRDPAQLLALSDRWGLESPLERFLTALEVAHSG